MPFGVQSTGNAIDDLINVLSELKTASLQVPNSEHWIAVISLIEDINSYIRGDKTDWIEPSAAWERRYALAMVEVFGAAAEAQTNR